MRDPGGNTAGKPPTIDGEVVGTALEPLNQGANDSRRRSRAGRFTEDDITNAVHLRSLGFTSAEIARKMTENGVPVTDRTVTRWYKAWLADHSPDRIDLAGTQARLLVRLEAMEHEAMRPARLFPGTKLALDGISQARAIVALEATLLGIEPPKRTEVNPNDNTGVDPGLVKLVEEARREAADRADRIREQYAKRNGLTDQPSQPGKP